MKKAVDQEDFKKDIEKLVALGKKKGFLTYDEVNEACIHDRFPFRPCCPSARGGFSNGNTVRRQPKDRQVRSSVEQFALDAVAP